MRNLFCIGGGELKNHTTLKLDEVLINKAKEHAKGNRPYALFIPTASHDFMPYYNTFHKVYTGIFNVKTDVALTVFHEVNKEKLSMKFQKADLIYIGGGDTVFMIDSWKKTGLIDLIKDAYERGVIIAGLSAGAIFAFEKIYTDSLKKEDSSCPYDMYEGLGWIKGVVSPHYDERLNDFDEIIKMNYLEAYGIENDSMIEIVDEQIVASYSSNYKNAYLIKNIEGNLKKEIVKERIIL